MKNILSLLSFLLMILIFINCNSPKPKAPSVPKTLFDYFQKTVSTDTMLFEIAEEDDPTVWGDTIPNSLLFTQIETHLMNGIEYFDNSGELYVIGRSRFPFSENTEAFVVDMRQNWYRHLSLFIFDKTKEAFIDRETVAEFYGGDGGQILTGSWLVDFDKDGDKDIVRREIEHWLVMDEEDGITGVGRDTTTGIVQRDTTTGHALLLRWEDNKFIETTSDESELINRFPIQSRW